MRRALFVWAVMAAFWVTALGWAQAPTTQAAGGQAPEALALDKNVIAHSTEIMANLTYLSDMIGHRLTGSAALKRANDWTAEKMKKYGLVNVHLEPWTLSEGWERGSAYGRIIEPDNGRTLSIAAFGWTPGTGGMVEGDVVILTAKKLADLEPYKGKLKGAIVLTGPPSKLSPIEEKPAAFPPPGAFKGKGKAEFNFEEFMAFRRGLQDFLIKEGAVATMQDAGKHLGLLFTTGIAAGSERPSATNKMPTLAVAHEHYALLYRLASRPAPARTRIALEVSNKFVDGPVAVYNTIGEIRGSEKPDEVVVVAAHLDSWDLGQGTLDNGTGTSVVLETARILAGCGVAPKRTVRFILFTGEEQGLLGSKAYVEKHKDEMERISACIVHDTGTGKVTGLGWLGRPVLKDILESELASLKDLGVEDLYGRGFGGSDHMSFDQAGVPGCIFRQENAGYRFAHHSQADTLDLVQAESLVQGAQVMAVTAMRFANRAQLLPRDREKKEKRVETIGADGFTPLFPKNGPPKGWVVREWNDVSKEVPAGIEWTVNDGVLQPGKRRGTWLMSEKEYSDFILEFEIKLTERGNSGVALRAPMKGDPAFDGMELQFADLRYNEKAKDSELTGGIYRAIAPTKQVYKPMEWNKCRVELKGTHLKVTLNDEVIQDIDLTKFDQPVKRHDGTDAPAVKDRPRTGHIGFQHLSRDNEPVLIKGARISVK